MKQPLSETEQQSLKTKGLLKANEIAYREENLIFAEDALSGEKRVINSQTFVKESKNILLG